MRGGFVRRGGFKHRGHRSVGEHLVDGRAQKRRDRQHCQFVELSLLGDRQRVGDHNLGDLRLLETIASRIAQDTVRCRDDDVFGTILEQRLRCFHDRAAGVDHVVDNHADSILHIANDLEDANLVRYIGVTAFVDDREGGAEDVGPSFGNAHPARVRRHHSDLVGGHSRRHVVSEEG